MTRERCEKTLIKATDIPQKMDFERIKQIVLQTSITAWNHHITESSLERWLSNFSGLVLGDEQAERIIAAWLLMNFTYYTPSEVDELCRVIYRKYIHTKLTSGYYAKLKASKQEKIRRILKRTLFAHLGNPSESGAVILYHFRTANELSKDVFEQTPDLKSRLSDGSVDDVVLIDDVTLSGEQAGKYIKSLDLGSTSVSLLTFFATPEALEKLSRENPKSQFIFAQLLDERTKLFSKSSFAFSSKDSMIIKDLAYELCFNYGNFLVQNELQAAEQYMKRYPLGFADGQQMFGFYYNTPDNTLPIFWCDTSKWHSVFRRHSKILNVEGVEISDEKYW